MMTNRPMSAVVQLFLVLLLTIDFANGQGAYEQEQERCEFCVYLHPVAVVTYKVFGNNLTIMQEAMRFGCRDLMYQGFFGPIEFACQRFVNDTTNVANITSAISLNQNIDACSMCLTVTGICTNRVRPCSPNEDDHCRACVSYVPYARLQQQISNNTAAMTLSLTKFCDSLSAQEFTYTEQLACRMQISNSSLMSVLLGELISHATEPECDVCGHLGACAMNARPCAMRRDDYCRVCTTLAPLAIIQVRGDPTNNTNSLQSTLSNACNSLQFSGYSSSEIQSCKAGTSNISFIITIQNEILSHDHENPCDLCTHLGECSNSSFPCASFAPNSTMSITTTMATDTTTAATDSGTAATDISTTSTGVVSNKATYLLLLFAIVTFAFVQ